jgi:AraC-like DNA-binding protein
VPWEELAVTLAVSTVRAAAGISSNHDNFPPNAEARVACAVRAIDRDPSASLALGHLARQAGLSPYHFLRTFERVTGITPHQYVRRARLREAGMRLVAEPGKVLDLALDSGFGDVSNFNRAFRAEFGMSPIAFRRTSR